MNSFRKNRKFLYFFIIGLIISLLLLFSINLFLLQNNKKYTYNDSIVSFENSNKNKFGSPFPKGAARRLTYEETKQEINYDLFSKLMDLTIKYNVNNVSDYKRLSTLNEEKQYIEFSRQELENDFLNHCTLIENDKYGKFFDLDGKYMFYIKFSNDGKLVDYNRYFNYAIKDPISIDLRIATLDEKFEIVKNFLDDYSQGLSNYFTPDTSYLDDSGTVYVWEDNSHNISFNYNLLYDCPCGFHIDFVNCS